MPLPPRSRRIGPVSRCAKCRRYCRMVATFLFSHVGLCGLVVGYSIIGAFTFEALEAGYEMNKRELMLKERQNVVNDLWNITTSSKILSEINWTALANEALQDFESTLVRAVRKDGYDGKDGSPLQWTFSGALLYSIIVITTIGYGNIAPKTIWGKIVTIFYAILGIPLLLLCLSNIGDAMAHSFRFIYWKVCCYFCIRPKKRRKKHSTLTAPGYRLPIHSSQHSNSIVQPPPASNCGTQSKPQRTAVAIPASPQNSVGIGSTSTYCTAPGTSSAIASPTSSPGRSAVSSPEIPTYDAVIQQDGLRNSHQCYRPAALVFQEASAKGLMLGPVIPNRYVLQCDTNHAFDIENELSRSSALDKPSVFNICANENSGYHFAASAPPAVKSSTNRLVWKHEVRRLDLDIDLTKEDLPHDDLSSDDEDDEEAVNVPMWLCVALVVSYICGGAVLFTFWEEWNFLDSSYFCFVTLTTIGFGDLVPGTAVISDDNQLTLGLCSLYLLFGMALLAMSFNLVQEEVTRSVRCIGQRMGIISDDEDD